MNNFTEWEVTLKLTVVTDTGERPDHNKIMPNFKRAMRESFKADILISNHYEMITKPVEKVEYE